MEPTEVGAVLVFVILGVAVIAVAIVSIRSLRRIPAPGVTRPPLERWGIREFKPGEKYILTYTGRLTNSEVDMLQKMLDEWWNNDKPLMLLIGADMTSGDDR